jgi:hypothetical protein
LAPSSSSPPSGTCRPEPGQVTDRQRGREEVPLGSVAPQAEQTRGLQVGLDALEGNTRAGHLAPSAIDSTVTGNLTVEHRLLAHVAVKLVRRWSRYVLPAIQNLDVGKQVQRHGRVLVGATE